MKTLWSDTETTALLAEIAQRQTMIEQQGRTCMQRTLDALKRCRRDEARDRFDLCLAWNEFAEFASNWAKSLSNESALTFVADAWFLQDLIRHLTPNEDEAISHVTGTRIGNVRILSRICNLPTAKQSPVYARANTKACADTEIEILERGNLLHAMAHCHPGCGSASTRPSGIDIKYLGGIQKVGSEAIGIIVTRDGWVRFFTVSRPFRVLVTGNYIRQVEEDVFHVEISNEDRDQAACFSR